MLEATTGMGKYHASAIKENVDFDHNAALEENAAMERDKTRRQTVANFVDGLISDMFSPAFETVEAKADFVDLVARIKSAVKCFEDGRK